MLWRKRLGLIMMLLFVSIVLVFVGCGKKTDVTEDSTYNGEVYPENGLPKNKKVTISAIYPVSGHGKEFFEYAVRTFQDKFKNVKIDIHLVESGEDTAQQLVDSIIMSGNDKDMYDWICSIRSSSYNPLIEDGKLEAQDELWERKLYDNPNLRVKDVIIGDKYEIFAANGHIYRFPRTLNIFGLYFNKKLFRENGWNERPKNWNEFMQLCAKIKNYGIYPMVMAGKYPFYFDFAWNAIPFEIGGEEFRNLQYSFAPDVYKSEPYIIKLKRMEEFARKGYFHPGTVSFDHTQSQMEFLQGKAALIPNGAWVANEMKDVVPVEFEWGFMPFPGNNKGGKQYVLMSHGSSGYIWKNRPELNKKWAKEFNLWLLNLDVALILAKSGGVPVRNDFEADPKIISPSVVAAMNAIKSPNVKVVNSGVRCRVMSNNEYAKLGKVSYEGYINLILGKKNVIQVSNDINNQYMKALNQEKKKDENKVD